MGWEVLAPMVTAMLSFAQFNGSMAAREPKDTDVQGLLRGVQGAEHVNVEMLRSVCTMVHEKMEASARRVLGVCSAKDLLALAVAADFLGARATADVCLKKYATEMLPNELALSVA